jgi:serpin B
MPTAFDEHRADFSGMTTQERLLIDEVLHEAFIAVDEAGTEAAAATAVVMRTESMPVVDVEMVVDRPFLFVLHDVATAVPLFIGRVTDPTDS